MKLKSLIVTIAVLAVLSVAVYFMNRPEAPVSSDPRVGKPVADASTLENAAKVKITDQGKTVLLTKQNDGTWIDSSYYDLPADFSKLSQFVGELTSANLQRLVTSNPEKISRLEFKDTQINILDSADKSLLSLTLGKNADSGGRFVRYGDEQKAYLANLNAWLDTEPKNWADSNLLSLKPDDIAKVELSFADGAPVVVKRAKKEEAFTAENAPAGEKLKNDKITGLLTSLTSLRFTDTSEPQDEKAVAAKANARTVKLTTFDGKTYSVALGRKPEQKIIKQPTATADGKTGPAALGKISDLAKKPEPEKGAEAGATTPAAEDNTANKEGGPAKILEPTTETIPAGPVYAFVTAPDANASLNALMQKRAFQVSEYILSNIPQKSSELFEPAQPPAPATKPESSAPSESKPEAKTKP